MIAMTLSVSRLCRPVYGQDGGSLLGRLAYLQAGALKVLKVNKEREWPPSHDNGAI